MIHQFAAASASIDSRKHAGICSAVDDPFAGRKRIQKCQVANIADANIATQRAKRFDVGFASLARKVVDANDRQSGPMLQEGAPEDAASKTTEARDEDSHF